MPSLMPPVHTAIGMLPARAVEPFSNAANGLVERFEDTLAQAEPLLLAQARGLTNEKQKELFLIAIDECRRFRDKIRNHFQQSIADRIKRLSEKSAPPGGPKNPDLLGTQFSLVEDDDLQERITLQTIVSNANASYDFQLDQVNSGLGRLLTETRITNQNNPFAPQAIGDYIHAAFTSVMIAQPARIAIYRLCKDAIFNRLLAVYQNLLRDLQQSGVTVQMRAAWTSDLGGDHTDTTDFLFGQQKKKERAPEPTTPAPRATPPAVILSVSELLKKAQQTAAPTTVGGDLSSPQHLLSARLNAKTIANDDLKPWLQEWMREQDCPTDMRTAIRDRLKKYSTNHTVLIITAQADNTLRFVAVLFNQLREHTNPTIATALTRWQMLIACLCLDDENFLDNTDQPPLILLDLALQLTRGANSSDKRITQRVLRCMLQSIDEYEENPLVFLDLVSTLEKLAQKELEATREQLEKTLSMLQLQTSRFAAFQAIDRFITERFSKLQRHLVFHELMHQEWRLILSEAYLDGGENGEPWILAVKLFDGIMLSLQSRGAEEDRTQLKKNLPKLAAGIKMLFEKYSIDENAYQSFADALAEIQRKVLQGIDVASLLDSDLLCTEEIRTILEHIDTERGSRYLEMQAIGADHITNAAMSVSPLIAADDCPSPAEAAKLLDDIKIMQWWIFIIDGEHCFCEYRYYFAALDKLVFIDRAGKKLFERARRDIINDMHTGYAAPTTLITGIDDAITRAIAAFAAA